MEIKPKNYRYISKLLRIVFALPFPANKPIKQVKIKASASYITCYVPYKLINVFIASAIP